MPFSTLSPRARAALLILLVAAVLVALTAAYWDYTQDDVFITFVYSRNIAEGNGFVFNPGERVQGTTTPLYALLMAGAYKITHDLLHAGNLISAACLGLTIVLGMRLLRPYVTRAAMAAWALLLVSAPLAYISFGMETLFYCVLLLLTLGLWARDRRVWAVLAAAAMTWTRADGLMMGVSLAIAALLDWPYPHRPAPDPAPSSRPFHAALREFGTLAAAYLAGIAPWFLFAWAYFGAPLPQTFNAKQEFLQGTQFLTDGAHWWRTLYAHSLPGWLTLCAIPLFGIGFVWAMRQRRLRALALWTFGYALGYTALNVTAFWYYTPLFVAVVLLTVLGGDRLARALIGRGVSRRLVLAGSLTLVALVTLLAVVRAWDYRDPPPRMATYTLAGEWIAAHTDPAATLMVKDLGIVGYYAHRYTLDSFGLIVPEMHDTTDTYANAKYKTDYTLTTQYWEMQRLAASDWFNAHFVPVAGFATPDDTEFSPMTLYRRRLALVPPAQAVQGTDLALTCTLDLDEAAPLPTETSARLRDDSGAVLVEAAHPFLWGQYPGERTLAPEMLVEQIALPLDVPPGEYTWELDCDQTTNGLVEVLPITAAAAYTTVDQPSWGDFARLAGVAAPEGLSTWSGGSLALLLHWEARGPAALDYSVFVHLVDSAGHVWAQADGTPRDGARPASGWVEGEAVIDPRRVMLPPDLPPGDYVLAVGWYDWQTCERVPLSASTTSENADAFTLPLTVTNQWPGGSGLPRH